MNDLSPAARERLDRIRARAAQSDPKRRDPSPKGSAPTSPFAALHDDDQPDHGPCATDKCPRRADYLVATRSGTPDRRCARCTRRATFAGAHATPIGDRS